MLASMFTSEKKLEELLSEKLIHVTVSTQRVTTALNTLGAMAFISVCQSCSAKIVATGFCFLGCCCCFVYESL